MCSWAGHITSPDTVPQRGNTERRTNFTRQLPTP